MKRFTLIVAAAIIAVATGSAQSSQQGKAFRPLGLKPEFSFVQQKKVPTMSSLQRQHDNKKLAAAREVLADPRNAAAPKASRRAIGDPLISEQPEGQFLNYVRTSKANYYYYGYFYDTTVTGGAADVVLADDGTIYVKNLISQYPVNSWSKGKIEGDKVVFAFPQPAMIYYGYEYFTFVGTYDDENLFVSKPEATLTLDWNPLTRTITTPADSEFATGELRLGLAFDDGEWAGYSDWDINLTLQTEQPIEAPEGVETTAYSVTADDYQGSLLNVGFVGNDIYLQGLYTALPEAWVKGTIIGNKAIFKSGQYLGSDGSYHEYLVSATGKLVVDPDYGISYYQYELNDNDIVFDYDADTKTLSGGSTFLINAGKDNVKYAAAFNNATIAPYVEVPATPATPEISEFYYYPYSYHTSYGWGVFQFDIPIHDVDGKFIDSNKLYYKLYVRVGDEEQAVPLYADSYIYLDEDLEEVPYGFSESWDIYSDLLYFYVTGFDAIGIQSVYHGGGEVRTSEIGWYETGHKQADKETPEYPELDPDNTGSTISYGPWDGVSDIKTLGEGNAQSYDVATLLKDEVLVGTHIDEISFLLLNTKGVSGLKVWLSSNLRVENGQAAPNLVEIPVEDAGPGIITVKLDKPYTISEKGVYVGYSFTIDDANIADNKKPIVVTSYATEGGLYVHSSKMYLGWTDLGEANAASTITVAVSGKSIKNNAVAPKANDITYVKVGEAVNITTTLLNYGANGITSLDLEYTLNGSTTEKHVELAKPVDGILGSYATIDVELPAIDERGNYDLQVKVVKVNGVDNEYADPVSNDLIVALNTIPKHRTLLEEYTGTWCGWCIRGYVGLQKLAELYPDDYVLVSYHNGDPMEILPSQLFPSYVAGFPTSWIDRALEVDPYYGYDEVYGEAPLTIVNALNDRAHQFGQADIKLSTALDTDENVVSVKTDVVFPYDVNNSGYALEYLLVADGLTGEEGTDWDQSNYYSGRDDLDENLAPFGEQSSPVPGLVFNDVAVQVSSIGGIKGSLPATIKADETNSHAYKFDLSEAVNTDNEPVIQDLNKLRVVALLIDTKTGEVVNANKAEVKTSTGITTVADSQNQGETVFYDLMGRRISTPTNGVYVKTVRTNNGQRSQKVLVK